MPNWPTDEEIDIIFANNTTGDITALDMRTFSKAQTDAGEDPNATDYDQLGPANNIVDDDRLMIVKGSEAYSLTYAGLLTSVWGDDGTRNRVSLAPNSDPVKWVEVRRRLSEVYVPTLRIDLFLGVSWGGSTTIDVGSILLPTAVVDNPQQQHFLVIDFADLQNTSWRITTDKQDAIETDTQACVLMMHYGAVWIRPGLPLQTETFRQAYNTEAPRHWLTQVANPANYKLRKGWVGNADISINHPPSALSGTPIDMPDGSHWDCTSINKGTELLYTVSGGTTSRASLYSGYNETMDEVNFVAREFSSAVLSGTGKIIKRGNGVTEIIPSPGGTVEYGYLKPPVGEYNMATLGQSLSELVVKEGGPGGFQAIMENWQDPDPAEEKPAFSFNMINGGSGGSSMCRTSPLSGTSTNYWKDLANNGGVGPGADGGAFTNFKAVIDRSAEIGQACPSIIFFDQGGGETRAITNGNTTIAEYRQAMDIVIQEAREYVRDAYPGGTLPLVCVVPFNSSDKKDEAHAITLLRREHISYTQDNPSFAVEHPNRNILYRAGLEPHYDGNGSAGLGGMMARVFIKNIILTDTASDNFAIGAYVQAGTVDRDSSSMVSFDIRSPVGFNLHLPGGITGTNATSGVTPFDMGILDVTGNQIDLAGAAITGDNMNTVELYGTENIPEEFDIMYPMRLGRDSFLAGDYPTAVAGYDAPVDRFNGVATLPLLPFLIKVRN